MAGGMQQEGERLFFPVEKLRGRGGVAVWRRGHVPNPAREAYDTGSVFQVAGHPCYTPGGFFEFL